MTDIDRDDILKKIPGLKSSRPAPEEQDHLGNKMVKPPSNKRALTVWLNPVAVKQFKVLARELEKTQEALLADALNMLFEHHHKPKIA
jgi:hypothetical protein